MRPLKSHFRADALTTLETVLKQTKEARVFVARKPFVRSLQATMSMSSPRPFTLPIPPCANGCSALPSRAPRV